WGGGLVHTGFRWAARRRSGRGLRRRGRATLGGRFRVDSRRRGARVIARLRSAADRRSGRGLRQRRRAALGGRFAVVSRRLGARVTPRRQGRRLATGEAIPG